MEKDNSNRVLEGSKIWIDIDNSPHVPFFRPIIEELEKRGCQILLTARDCFQVCGLMDMFRFKYVRIGHHSGKNKARKLAGLFIRAGQLAPCVINEKPDLAVSHGSRAQMILARMLRIPSACGDDYEPAKEIPFFRADWYFMPEVIPDNAMRMDKNHIIKYPGIKEDVYVPDFKPDSSIKNKLGLNGKDLIITIRPPATEAHYFNPRSKELFDASLDYLGRQEHLRLILLPRNEKQTAWIKKEWPEWYADGKIIIPEEVVDGLNLIWHSDLVISGGGTMNREAAALGVPVYSIFRGKIGAVDKYLAEKGRLVLLESPADVKTKVNLAKRQDSQTPGYSNRNTLKSIIDGFIRILEEKKIH